MQSWLESLLVVGAHKVEKKESPPTNMDYQSFTRLAGVPSDRHFYDVTGSHFKCCAMRQ